MPGLENTGFKAVSPSNPDLDRALAQKTSESILERPDFSVAKPQNKTINNPDLPGRPRINMNEDQKLAAIELAKEGKVLKQIRAEIGINTDCWHRSFERDPRFAEQFAFARQIGLEEVADDLLTIGDDEPDVLRARLKSENMRWILSKRKPSTYGDRIDLNISQVIDIGTALSDARARALGITDKHTIDITVRDEDKEVDDLLS